MATIKPIEAKTIHQIQSGQVIVDLCSVVKELVENSIDAGATNIEVRFKNQGLDAIEVQDNGSGISKENYETLALKHYTSKLATYSDLESLETFGFRGEALSSLCALSRFTVTTCVAADAPKASRLEFETSGKLRSTSIVAAQKGTTVSVEGLFHNLPVRRRELERNIKREWNKVLGVLNQYACIQTDLKFSVSQQPNKGRRIVLFSTKGNKTTRENIANVFGAKTLTVLIPMDLELELEPTTTSNTRQLTQASGQAKIIRIKGHVSRPAYGEGRQTPDRQMFFVNGRPCGLPQFAKVFNEVYKSYNSSQSPFIFADIQLDTHLYDVNVSPDKRTILLHDQTRMLNNLREALGTLFESQDYALPTSQLQAPKQSFLKPAAQGIQSRHLAEASTTRSLSVVHINPTNVIATGPRSMTENTDDESENDRDAEQNITADTPVSASESAQGVQTTSLITRWAERKSELRVGKRDEEEGAADSATNNSEQVDSHASPPLSREQTPQRESPIESGSRVEDFRARLELLKNRTKGENADQLSVSQDPVSEPPIPSVAASSGMTDYRSKLQHSSPSIKRFAPEIATITVGDHTATSVIGGPSKKQRIEDKLASRVPARKDPKKSKPMPSFNGRLTQMFAAHASRSSIDKSQLETDTAEDHNSQDSDASSEGLFVKDDGDEESGDEETVQDVVPEENEQAVLHERAMSRENSERETDEQLPTSPENLSDFEGGEKEAGGDDKSSIDGTAEGAQDGEVAIPEKSARRTKGFVKGTTRKKDATYHLQQALRIDQRLIRDAFTLQQEHVSQGSSDARATLATDRLDAEDAEEKLSLTISKSDFERMKIIGQFNLGFIIASRTAEGDPAETQGKNGRDDELFIIDQHATDEKYNFERLQANTVVQSQRLVHPKTLELTALEEDIVQENMDALEANGFIVSFDGSGDQPVGTRCQLLSLPLSRETTFSLADLEELISLLGEQPPSFSSSSSPSARAAIPRPSKVRKMFAMRACRSSVMIGKPLSVKQMEKLVRHMGELDKPWNCPHGRPTMRHLCGLSAWDEVGWREGDNLDGSRPAPVDWAVYLRGEAQ
ncbi:DNA mismatch repair protein MutL [Xylariaceae sp. FL0594]|nr:DNA mismatch repair protein MutL [Xylariaceae sp. FL0594]